MGDKEKTFSDLFASSDTKDDSTDVKSTSFSDIFKSSLSMDKNLDDTSSSDTKDDNFSEISTKDFSGDSISFNLDSDTESNEILDTSIFTNNGDVEKDDSELKDNDFVDKDIEDNNLIQEERNSNFSNPFFDADVKEDEVSEKKIDLQIDGTSENVNENSNPFFDSDVKEEDKTEENLDLQIDNTTDESSDNDSSNPLFDSVEKDEASTEEKVELQIDDTLEAANAISNPFFGNDVKEEEKNEEKIDLQLGSAFDKEDNSNSVILNDNQSTGGEMSTKKEKEDKKEKVLDKEKKKESNSPFFDNSDDNVVSSENPLFLSKLNLIENENQDKKIDSLNPDNSKHFNVKIVKKKEPLIKVLIGVISYAIFIWLLFIGIALLVYVLDIKIRAQKGDYSAPTYNAYVVLTGSMLPQIQVKDVVVTKKTKPTDLKEGDVITFASADTRFLGTIITHRIIKKNYDAQTKSYTFQTKGDNNNVADSALVPQNNIYGRVILKIPKLGYLQEFLATDGGWIIVILIPCLAVLSYDIVKIAKGLKRRKYKNIKVQK